MRQLLCKLGREPPCPDCINKLYAAQCAGDDSRRLFLTYLHCLYEANIASVLVKPNERKVARSVSIGIFFLYYRLTIHDISYYLLSITRISHSTDTMLSLSNCFIDDYGIETLVANITKQAQRYHSHHSTLIGLTLES